MTSCPRCQRPLEVGVLCAACAAALAPADGLLPDHVMSRAAPGADAWLVDGFGAAHPVAAARTRIGRRPDAELVVLHGSVSRDHAELALTAAGWQVRDLGSRNATHVDGRRVEGRAAVDDLAIVRVGDVPLLFVARPAAVAVPKTIEPATTRSADAGVFRVVLRGPAVELCALGGGEGGTGGALMYRTPGTMAWTELNLPPLEFHLLRTLCTSALAAQDSPQRSRGAVLTKKLARALPFQSRYANDENVRQVVRRLRTTLDEIGATGLIETVPGRGYFVAWPVGTA